MRLPKGGQALSGNAIQERIDSILKNPDSPYWKKGHPMRAQTLKQLNALYAAQHGNEAS